MIGGRLKEFQISRTIRESLHVEPAEPPHPRTDALIFHRPMLTMSIDHDQCTRFECQPYYLTMRTSYIYGLGRRWWSSRDPSEAESADEVDYIHPDNPCEQMVLRQDEKLTLFRSTVRSWIHNCDFLIPCLSFLFVRCFQSQICWMSSKRP